MNVSCSAFRSTAIAALALLAGCSGLSSSSSSAASNPLGIAALPHRRHAVSWMSDEAKKAKSLLYVPDYGEFQVLVYAWPNPVKPIGTLAGDFFTFPTGACADTSGHVYIVDAGSDLVVEYKTGGTVPLRKMANTGTSPVSCSVDPTTGDLAVANFGTSSSGDGSVSIYPNAKRPAKNYIDPKIWNMDSLSYDAHGMVWIDGNPSFPGFLYASFDPATGKFQNKALQGASVEAPGGVAFDGKHITVGDAGNPVVYQTDKFKIVGNTPLTFASGDYTIVDGTLVGPGEGAADVYLYTYPAGGSPFRTLSQDLGTPWSAAVTKSD